MTTVRTTIPVHRDVKAELRQQAEELRQQLTRQGTLIINLLSSPGAGKTSLLEATAQHWKGQRRMAVLVGDLATDRDARRLAAHCPVEQLTTGGACHLEIPLVQAGWEKLGTTDVEFLFIENVGNLVCPASHDLAEHLRVVLLSVTEGDDKPGKYPKMFRTSQALVVSKLDLLEHVPFSVPAAIEDARQIQPDLEVFPVCSLTGDGIDAWCAALGRRREALLRDACDHRQPQLAMSTSEAVVAACRMQLEGQVQGVGLRPAVARLAREVGLAGYVRNVAAGVEIHMEGPLGRIEEFRRRVQGELPGEARLSAVSSDGCQPLGMDGFAIVESNTSGPLTTRVPADVATCAACLAEVVRAADRRFQYAFISCTGCGPRYSIIDAMPYDRCRTSMQAFDLCQRCAAEYDRAEDRRFHAQTNACGVCGPSLQSEHGSREQAFLLGAAADAVLAGDVLALRGLGGYQLVVDATNEAAVKRLRLRKRRSQKPLAVMVQTLEDAERLVVLTEQTRTLLSASDRPIVLLPVRVPGPLAVGIHPELTELGLFLPTTALHWLLLDRVNRPLVVTSGNLEGEPLVTAVDAAQHELSGIADCWLHHDREIWRPIDDSVVRVISARPVTLRLARGLAPLSLPAMEGLLKQRTGGLDADLPAVLAVGGHQKNAVALFNGSQAVLGPHIGDLDSVATRQRFVGHVEELLTLYRCPPPVIVHDLHPDYFTTRWAQESGSRTLGVQHHHAHVVSAMLENGWLSREVLGVACDGTGYGSDGTVWGGEFLRAQ